VLGSVGAVIGLVGVPLDVVGGVLDAVGLPIGLVGVPLRVVGGVLDAVGVPLDVVGRPPYGDYKPLSPAYGRPRSVGWAFSAH